MLTRILTAVGIAAVLVPTAFLSDTVVFPIVIALLAGMGCFEMLRCIGLHKNLLITIPAVLLGIGLPFASFYLPQQAFMLLSSLSAVLMFLLFTVSLFSHGKLPIEQAGMAFIALIYILWGFCLMVLLRRINNGAYLYLLPFLGAWVSDSFAYFTGRLLGRHKLIPDVSPKKTVEGAIGGIVFAMAGFALYGWIVSLFADVSPNYPALILLGLPVSLVSIVGDLFMSLVKRRYDVKDYGRLFPGHGGVLDRFDSVLATATVLYLLCANTPFFALLF
ncbi:MAG: phosphatidate cytidylyltransferase [Ruminococcaceae bacterium]|nr:phosphatidate cytidylyltransferase [Oscillospiraceae bacterium]